MWNSDRISSAEVQSQMLSILQRIQGKPPAIRKLHNSFTTLKSKVDKALGKDTANVVVGLPVYLSTETREQVRLALEKAGFKVRSTIRQPALASTVFDFYRPAARRDFTYTVLVVEYNRASLDLAITPSAHGASDVLAHVSYPKCGEDALDLQVAGLLQNTSTGTHTIIGHSFTSPTTLAKEIRIQRSLATNATDFESRTNLTHFHYHQISKIERQHHASMRSTLENFVQDYSTQLTYNTSVGYGALLTDDSHLMISGDASDASFEELRRSLLVSEVQWPLADTKDSPNPMKVAAKGAAIEARRRLVGEDLETQAAAAAKALLEAKQKLLKEKGKSKVVRSVPHDL